MHHTEELKKLTALLPTIWQARYDAETTALMNGLSCPHCQNTAGFRLHDYRPRHLYLDPGTRITITITRLKCSCQKTFTLMPDWLIPFKRYVMAFVLEAIRMTARHRVYWTANSLELDSTTIRRWWSQFRQFHQALATAHRLDQCPRLASQRYAKLRHGRRLMQIISAHTPHFHALFD